MYTNITQLLSNPESWHPDILNGNYVAHVDDSKNRVYVKNGHDELVEFALYEIGLSRYELRHDNGEEAEIDVIIPADEFYALKSRYERVHAATDEMAEQNRNTYSKTLNFLASTVIKNQWRQLSDGTAELEFRDLSVLRVDDFRGFHFHIYTAIKALDVEDEAEYKSDEFQIEYLKVTVKSFKDLAARVAEYSLYCSCVTPYAEVNLSTEVAKELIETAVAHGADLTSLVDYDANLSYPYNTNVPRNKTFIELAADSGQWSLAAEIQKALGSERADKLLADRLNLKRTR